MRRIMALLTALLVFTACDAASAEEDLAGLWKPCSIIVNGEASNGDADNVWLRKDAAYEFTSRGTVRIKVTDTMRYTATDDTLSFSNAHEDGQTETYSLGYEFRKDRLILNMDFGGVTVYDPCRRVNGSEGLTGIWYAMPTLDEAGLEAYLSDPEYYESLLDEHKEELRMIQYFTFTDDGLFIQDTDCEMCTYSLKDGRLALLDDPFGELETLCDLRFEGGQLILTYETERSVFRVTEPDGALQFDSGTDVTEVYLERVG